MENTEKSSRSQPLSSQLEQYFRECRSQAVDFLEEEIERIYPHGKYKELLDPKYDWDE